MAHDTELRKSVLSDTLENLNDSVTMLFDNLRLLEDVLNPICGEYPPEEGMTADDGEVQASSHSQIVERLEHEIDRVRHINARVNKIQARIEL